MQIVFVDSEAAWTDLLPLTYTRPINHLRVGILRIFEKWSLHFAGEVYFNTADYLQEKFPNHTSGEALFIRSGLLPQPDLIEAIGKLKTGESLCHQNEVLAAKGDEKHFYAPEHTIDFPSPFSEIKHPWDLFRLNGQEIERDFHALTVGRKSEPIHESNLIIGDHPIFLEAGAKAFGATFNTSNGPIYLGKNTEVMEGSLVRGPFALCEGASLKLGAKIYGPTTVGPHSKVGGEVNNSIIQGYSNKGHDGFLGNSVLGEWCNIGADSNNSNLKNNYAEVRLWNYNQERFIPTGLQFCGLIMGDHSKCGINTMFNTGTVVGVSANIFGAGFPRNFVPSFSWGGAQGVSTYATRKAFEVAEKVMERRGMALDDKEINILNAVFERSSKFRKDG